MLAKATSVIAAHTIFYELPLLDSVIEKRKLRDFLIHATRKRATISTLDQFGHNLVAVGEMITEKKALSP